MENGVVGWGWGGWRDRWVVGVHVMSISDSIHDASNDTDQ